MPLGGAPLIGFASHYQWWSARGSSPNINKEHTVYAIRIKTDSIEIEDNELKLTRIFYSLNEALDYIKLCYSREDAPREIQEHAV